MADCVSVQVALRVRPLVDTEIQRGCQISLECIPNEPQVVVKGADKAFTFNYVFGPDDGNEHFYETAVKEMVSHVFKGYNVTILAYGQTGSGKTYSMGTTYGEGENYGVIPRAVNDIFKSVEDIKDKEFKITVSFMELYQEQVFDLLDENKSTVDIREIARDVIVPGLTEVIVHSTEETIECLVRGSLGRATGATAMNAQSSRSHAIFTIIVHQQSKSDESNCMTSKFHLVDLAGSERSKKTKASGERFKEGININRGLFALGNVISALGEECQKGYISYRDSKLTRLLQDSLGGNSLTLMIACVSPADYNLDETLSTLRYADRARRIKNKPMVNQDPTVAHIAKLKQDIRDAQAAIQNSKQSIQCPNEHLLLQEKNECLSKTHIELAEAFDKACNKKCLLEEYIHSVDVSRDCLKEELKQINSAIEKIINNLSQLIDSNPSYANFKQQFQQFQNLKTKIKDLLEEQNLNPEEIFNKECAVGIINSQDNVEEKVNNFVNNSVYPVSTDEDTNKRSLLQRIELSKQLVRHNRALADKQKIVDQLTLNSTETENQNSEHKNAVQNLELQVQILQKEKEELLNSLQEIKNSALSPRKESQFMLHKERLSELQKKINFLMKKISEKNEIIKRKEREEQKMKVLNNEITLMNEKKLSLIKQMNNASENFKFLKLQCEKEILILLEKDRKGKKQMRQIQKLHAREQNIWRKKLENAIDVNKRLKDALAVGKSAQEKHKIMDSTTKVHIWLLHELKIMHSIKDAEMALEELMEERTLFTEQLSVLSKSLADGAASDDEKYLQEEQIKQLAENISARNAQIADLQQKIIDGDEENKNKTRWDCFQNVSEAKCALKYLINTAMDDKKENLVVENMVKNLTLDIRSKEKIIQVNQIMMEEKTKEHQQQIINLETEYQEKALLLLKHHFNSNGALKFRQVLEEFWNKEKKIELLEEALKQNDTEQEKISNEEREIAQNNLNEEQQKDDTWQSTPVFKRIQSLKSCNSNESRESEKSEKRALSRNSIFTCVRDTCSLQSVNISSPVCKRNLLFSSRSDTRVNKQSQNTPINETEGENIKKPRSLNPEISISQTTLGSVQSQSEDIYGKF